MRYRRLGRTGIEVSELGLGTYPLGGALQTSGSYWAGPATYGAVRRDEAIATIHAAISHGITFIDTAPVYGEAEVFIGAALRDRPPNIAERRCYVATKCGEHVRPVTGGAPELARDFSRSALQESLERSRVRLGVGMLDLAFLHSPGPKDLGEDPLGLLVERRDRGEIAHFGVSARSVDDAIRLIEHDGRAEVIQAEFNLLDPRAADRLFPLAIQHGVGIVARVPLASGFLTGLIGEDHVFSTDDYRSAMSREDIARLARQATSFRWLVGEGIAGSLAEAALRYIVSFPAVSTVIAGVMRHEELLLNRSAIEAGPLPDNVIKRIKRQQEA